MSAPQIEREIRQLLNRLGSADAVAHDLIKRWQKNLFDLDEQAAVAQFLITSGQEPLLLEETRRLLQTKRAIPWVQFAATLSRVGLQWHEDEIKALREGLCEQEALTNFASWAGSLKIDPDFAKERAEIESERRAAQDSQRELLRDQLAFFRNQRMYDEEAATLQKLKALYPDDPEFQLDQDDLAERWARDVLANYSGRPTELTEELLLRTQELPAETKSIKDLFTSQALVIAKQRPQHAYDLALMFLFMEFYTDALEILAHSPLRPQRDWLRLDLLLKARQYVTVLDEAARMELEYSSEPESTFSVIYARARALWGLGQASAAIDLMRSIVRVRPNYRSARSLLLDWSGGEA